MCLHVCVWYRSARLLFSTFQQANDEIRREEGKRTSSNERGGRAVVKSLGRVVAHTSFGGVGKGLVTFNLCLDCLIVGSSKHIYPFNAH